MENKVQLTDILKTLVQCFHKHLCEDRFTLQLCDTEQH